MLDRVERGDRAPPGVGGVGIERDVELFGERAKEAPAHGKADVRVREEALRPRRRSRRGRRDRWTPRLFVPVLQRALREIARPSERANEVLNLDGERFGTARFAFGARERLEQVSVDARTTPRAARDLVQRLCYLGLVELWVDSRGREGAEAVSHSEQRRDQVPPGQERVARVVRFGLRAHEDAARRAIVVFQEVHVARPCKSSKEQVSRLARTSLPSGDNNGPPRAPRKVAQGEY